MIKNLDWKSAREHREFVCFLTGHIKHILACGNLAHFRADRIYPMSASGMEVKIEYDYLEFELGYGRQWAIDLWQGQQYDKLITYLCHELTHLVVEEIEARAEFKTNLNERRFYFERVTEHCARWLERCYEQYRKEHKITLTTGK